MKQLLLTCEHASRVVPNAYRKLIPLSVLKTHRGYDIGAEYVFEHLKKCLPHYAQKGQYSRLVVDLNRSINNASLLSEYIKSVSKEERAQIIEKYYRPYHNQLIDQIMALLKKGLVIHVAVHSFTPVLNGKRRQADIGLLYNPTCSEEKQFCQTWAQCLRVNSNLVIRMNYPYKGISDGLSKALRQRFGEKYLGMELEINQALLHGHRKKEIAHLLCKTLSELLRK